MKNLVFILLLPFSFLYGLVSRFRNFLYDSRFLKTTSFENVKTISVGNLCAGGSGKTPHTETLLALLGKEFNVACLSRGYGRNTTGFAEVLENSIPENTGDEPLQIKRKFNTAYVTVCENRVRGIKHIIEKNPGTDVIILDDAFQHRKLKCGLSILLTEYHHPFFEDSLLPAGRLRENKKGYLRADIIIVTKTPDFASPIDLKRVLKEINPRPYQNLYFSYLNYGELYSLFDSSIRISTEQKLFLFRVLLITGIANPVPMLTWVKEYADDVMHKSFPDHHNFTPADIRGLISDFSGLEADNKIIITTEKDAMRLQSYSAQLKDLPIFVLPIEIDFKSKKEEFNEKIFGYVRQNKIYHRKYS